MPTNASIAKPSRQVTEGLAAKSRNRRHDLKGEIALAAIASSARRNDLIPDMKLVPRQLSSLRAPKRNVRKADKLHQAEIAASVAELGFAAPPIVTGDGEIIDGVNKVEAARALGLTEIPCVEVNDLSPTRIKLLRTALNRLGEKGGWDLGELKVQFEELVLDEAPILVSGFTAPEIDILLSDGGSEPKANNVPKVAIDEPPVSQIGDLWLLGRHRVLCGDATKSDSYITLFGDEPAARAVFTDPPYNIKIDGFAVGAEKHKEFVAASGEMTDDEFVTFLTSFLWAAAGQVMDGGVLFVCMDWRHAEHVHRAARDADLAVINTVVWSKGNGGLGGLYRSAHELVFVLKKGDAPTLNNVGLGKHGRDRTNVWVYPGANTRGSSANDQAKNHPTPKPVELVADAILDVTERHDIVLDSFLGSGTTIIAAEKTGRTAYGLELDPHYVDVIVKRFQKFTGVAAKHAATGLSFDEVMKAQFAAVPDMACAAGADLADPVSNDTMAPEGGADATDSTVSTDMTKVIAVRDQIDPSQGEAR